MLGEKILIVEDDEAIAGALQYKLALAGFSVKWAPDAPEALRLFRAFRPDLVLLDLMLPGGSGIRVCERIRQTDEDVAVIVVTARDAEEDKVRGFEAGADDYVTKPFGMKELLARINANLRRNNASRRRGRVIEAGPIRLDTRNHVATFDGEPLELRVKEFELLAALAGAHGELKTREELAKEVWGHAGVGSSRTIDVHIRRIRAALARTTDQDFVRTARGLGYRFEIPDKTKTSIR